MKYIILIKGTMPPRHNRFINCDSIIPLNTALSLLNQFAYGNNTPVLNKDSNGSIPETATSSHLYAAQPIPEFVLDLFEVYELEIPYGYQYSGYTDTGVGTLIVSFNSIDPSSGLRGNTTYYSDYVFLNPDNNIIGRTGRIVLNKIKELSETAPFLAAKTMKDTYDNMETAVNMYNEYNLSKNVVSSGKVALGSLASSLKAELYKFVAKSILESLFSQVRIDTWETNTIYNKKGKIVYENKIPGMSEYIWG